jgi:GTP pyrophosphokinase
MKIAGETDYFYAPLANRLGLFDVKSDLENLSFKYRCPYEYFDILKHQKKDMDNDKERLKLFTSTIESLLHDNGIEGVAEVYYRRPYSIWRRMNDNECDYVHVQNRYYVRVTFTKWEEGLKEKEVCVKIYSILTDVFKEKPGSFNNLIDQAKENSYRCLNVMLLSKDGIWEDVQICSEKMVESSKLGCMTGLNDGNIDVWIKKFQRVLKDIAESNGKIGFMENVATTLYYDDVMVFTPKGKAIILPKGSTAIDFAFELDNSLGMHAKYARINGKLCSMKTKLNRGDCVEIGTVDNVTAKSEWMDYTSTYKAKRALRFIKIEEDKAVRCCPYCKPLPGGETIGFRSADGTVVIHRRSCSEAIMDASKYGDSIVEYDFKENPNKLYPVSIVIKAIDRYHLLMDIIQCITQEQKLSIDSLNTVTEDEIVTCHVTFFAHSINEVVGCMQELYLIQGIDEVKYKTINNAG